MTPVARRDAVAHARAAFSLSERRACAILGIDRTSVRYRSSRGEDADLLARVAESDPRIERLMRTTGL